MTWHVAAQVWIGCFSLTAVFLTQSSNPKARRWACILGLISQPGWFYSAWTAGQMGIFLLSFFYTYSWARGLWFFWLKKAPA